MKPICILDACSYIYLKKALNRNYRNKDISLFTLLESEFTIKYSEIVNQEISNHTATDPSIALKRHNYTHRTQEYTMERYEEKIFGSLIVDNEDKGEKHNFAICLDLFLTNSTNLIFFTDNEKAKNNVLKEQLTSYPISRLWNSYDFVLYLYIKGKNNLARHLIFDFDMAKEAIDDLVSYRFSGARNSIQNEKPNLSRDDYSRKVQDLNNSVSQIKIKYLKHLNNIQQFKNR